MNPKIDSSAIETLKTAAMQMTEEQALDFGKFCQARAETLKKERQEKAREDADAEIVAAMDRARILCEKAGIPFTPTLPKNGKKAKKNGTGAKPAYVPKAGHIYQHPDNPALTCKGTGPRPEWWHALLKAGKEPKDLGPVKEPQKDVRQPAVAAS